LKRFRGVSGLPGLNVRPDASARCRFGSVLLSALLMSGLTAGMSVSLLRSPTGVTTPVAVQQSVPGELDAADEASALRRAYETRKPVLVTNLTTPTSLTFAQPDGTFKSTLHMAPHRVRVGQEWVDVDLTLVRNSDGSVTPKAHPDGLRLSGARGSESDGLVTMGSGAQPIELGWRGALPEPVLSGARATYQEVKPGIDLVVEARRSGFEYFLTVKNAQAAAQLKDVSMPWRADPSVTSALAGDMSTLDVSQVDPVTISGAVMWDSQAPTVSGERRHATEMPMSLVSDGAGGTTLEMSPVDSYLSDPRTVYPVTIDPSVTLHPQYDAFIENTYASDQSGSTELKLGYSDDGDNGCGSGCTARTLMNIYGLSAYAGATVVSADLFLYETWSWNCTQTEWQAWRTGASGTASRWSNQPAWIELLSTSTDAKGYSGCSAGWVDISVKGALQPSLSNGWDTAPIGLRATSESNHLSWKKFASAEASSGDPYIELIYNRTPNVPTGLTIDSCYSACASPAIVRSGTPTLSATVSDPDGGTLRTEYEVYDSAKTTLKAKSGTSVTGVSSGTARGWKVVPSSGATLPDATYNYRVRACDSYVCGGYSGWFTFTVNTSDPSLPAVSGDIYKAKSTGTWNGGPNQPGTFTFGPNGAADVTEYVYDLNGGNSITVPAGVLGTEKLTANQQQVSTDLTGFGSASVTMTRDTTRGQGGTGQSLKLVPLASGGSAGGPVGDTFANFSGSGMTVGMQAGKRYRISGWIYVPAATGLNPTGTDGLTRGLRLTAWYKVGTTYTMMTSAKASITDNWQQLTVDMTLPATATEAFVRMYNGFNVGETSKAVYWDAMSVKEVTGTSTAVSISPPKGGSNVLSVRSRTAAGSSSDPTIYEFLVKPSDAEWLWTMGPNGAGTGVDSVPSGFTAAIVGQGASFVEGHDTLATALDGTSYLQAGSPVLDTASAAGFTVAAWVRLTDVNNGNRVAVSQGDANGAMFTLGFRSDLDLDADSVNDKAWCFIVRNDATGSQTTQACTTEYVVEGDWVALAGVMNRSTNKIQLYVNGGRDNPLGNPGTFIETDFNTPTASTGVLTIGGATTTPVSGVWKGELDSVAVAQRAWIVEEAQQHAAA